MTIASDISSVRGLLNSNSGRGITNISGAIQALQSAGNVAVGSIGPAIDQLSGGDSKVMTMTQWAWQKNAVLSGINSGGDAKQDDLSAAVADLKQMLDWYDQANRLAASLGKSAPTPSAKSPGVVHVPTSVSAKPMAVAMTPPVSSESAVVKYLPSVGLGLIGLSVLGPLGLVLGAGVGYFVSKKL